MHIAVNLGVQKLASFQVDNLLPEEIDHELNLAQLRFVKQRFNSRSNRQGRGFEQSQKRIDDLNKFVESYKNTTKGNSQLIFGIDDDDHTYDDFIKDNPEFIYEINPGMRSLPYLNFLAKKYHKDYIKKN